MRSTKTHGGHILLAMENEPESPMDALWKEYGNAFKEWDDMTLARWLSQTLSQLAGRGWRLSHPLLGAYRLAAHLGYERQVWLKRLASPPSAYAQSQCCRAPMLPLLTRDVKSSGLICQHCSEILVPFDEIPREIQSELEAWAKEYEPVHAVAHWDDRRRKGGHYETALEEAAQQAERLLARAGAELAPKLLEFYPAVVWEDQDECLEVRPEDVRC